MASQLVVNVEPRGSKDLALDQLIYDLRIEAGLSYALPAAVRRNPAGLPTPT
jgi:hypothetical protein